MLLGTRRALSAVLTPPTRVAMLHHSLILQLSLYKGEERSGGGITHNS